MSFFAILFALLIEQVRPLPRGNAVHDALTGWTRWTAATSTPASRATAGSPGASPCSRRPLLTWGVFFGLAQVSSLLGLAFDVAVLYVTLGFRQFSHHFTDIRDALDDGDEVEARRLLGEWQQVDASELPRSEIVRHVIEYSVLAAHRHVFGVLAWFSLLSTLRPRPGRRGALSHGRVRQPLLGVQERRRRDRRPARP